MKNIDKKNYQKKLIVILGPTASGKSNLAVNLALKFNGEIISADSRQIYKGMDIGSGKITKKEMQGIPHYLLDVASPKKRFSVSQFQKLARKKIKDIRQRGKLPILCGGTGLYIQSIVNDLVIPEVPPDAKLRAKLEKLNTEKLFIKLQKLDPRRAQNIDRHNRRRLIRALEIVIKTGNPIPRIITLPHCHSEQSEESHALKDSSVATLPQNDKINNFVAILQLGIAQPKEKLKILIKKRLLRRLKQGMVAEVKKLHKQGVSWKRLEEFGLEYRAAAQYLKKKTLRHAQGKLFKQQMIDKIQKESEQYAKRQITWFKRDKKIKWIKNYDESTKIIKNFLKSAQ